MIGVDVVIARISGLKRQDLERWISNAWVRPDKSAGDYAFREIDVARARLILEMRDEIEINEDALPVVLSLLDQLYDLRRQMRDLNNAFMQVVPSDARKELAAHLTMHSSRAQI
jgi:chaperone modulatory protein CbpM